VRVAAAAVLGCCAVHVGVVGAVVGWSIGALAGVPAAAVTMAVLVVVTWRRGGRCDADRIDVGHAPERTP
jgi:hypothetical protein